jgi:hypothetical protein
MMITKTDIEKTGNFDYEVIDSNIFLIKNFLSDKDQKILLDMVSSLSEKDWQNFDDYQSEDNWKNRLFDHGQNDIASDLKIRVEAIFASMLNPNAMPYKIILRQFPGGRMVPHADDDFEPSTRLTKKRISAAIVYINDNYDGGDLHFINKKIKIKPPAKSLMLFETGDENLHEVEKIKGDIARYCLPSFVFVDLPI